MKIAVIFPGVGYHTEKPLLYYSKKIAKELGYDIVEVNYKLEGDIKDDYRKMEAAFESGLKQTEEILSNINFDEYEDILFISKSIGTAISSAYAKEHNLPTRNVLYTPVSATYFYLTGQNIAFHGTSDTWADTESLVKLSEECNTRLNLITGANHSLESDGDVTRDLKILVAVMQKTTEFILEAKTNTVLV